MIERTAKTVINRKKFPSRADVLKAREVNIARGIAGIISENHHAAYLQTVKELSESYAFGDIAAAALCAAFGQKKDASAAGGYIPEESSHLPVEGDKYERGKAAIKSFGSKPHARFHKSRKNRYRFNSKTVMHRG